MGFYRFGCSVSLRCLTMDKSLSCPEPRLPTCTMDPPYLRGLVMMGDDAGKCSVRGWAQNESVVNVTYYNNK